MSMYLYIHSYIYIDVSFSLNINDWKMACPFKDGSENSEGGYYGSHGDLPIFSFKYFR